MKAGLALSIAGGALVALGIALSVAACGHSQRPRGDGEGPQVSPDGPPAPLPPPAPEPVAGPPLEAVGSRLPGCPAAAALPAGGGRTYHVCDCAAGADSDCRAGDDAADGLGPERAWRSFEKARAQFASLAAGETIAFCRGGVFTPGSSRGWVNTSCRADRRCIVRDYVPGWGSGDEKRPLWMVSPSGAALALEDGGNSTHDEGYVFANLELRGSGSGRGIFIYNDVDDVLLEGLVVTGFDIGVQAAGSNAPEPGSDGRNARIVLRNSRLADNPGQGYLGGSDASVIECNRFENNGSSTAVLSHNLYLAAEEVRGFAIRNNELYRSTIVGGKCRGVSLVVHGQIEDLDIDGNLVREDVGAADPECWGIAIDGGYASAERFTRVNVRGNRVLNVGNVGIGLGSCVDCLVENNVVVHEQPFEVIAVAVPDRRREGADATLGNVTVRNNSVFMSAGSGGGVGIALSGEGTGHAVVSNAIFYAGNRPVWSCFDLSLPAAAYRLVDHNVCAAGAGAGAGAGAVWTRGRGDLAAWRRASGFDAHSVAADPRFSMPAGPAHDLMPAPGSPAIGAGHPSASASKDIEGRPRPRGPAAGAPAASTAPAAGAFEVPSSAARPSLPAP
jgi:hypothetical protein